MRGMIMDKKIKEYMLIETRDAINFKKFDELYSVFEQIIEYDVASYAIEGISERMTTYLTQIATEKVNRVDIINCFSGLSGCFEPYVKKVLYLIDKNKYDELKSKKDTSLPDYLEGIGLKLFLPKEKRNDRSQKLFITYNLRNTESHECKMWSLTKLYRELQALLCSYLLVTEQQLPALKNILLGNDNTGANISKLDIDSFKKMSPEQMIRFLRWGIVSMNPMVKELTSTGYCLCFDETGMIKKEVYENSGFYNNTTYRFFGNGGIIKRERHVETIYKGSTSEEMKEYCNLYYNYQDRCERAEYYKCVADVWKNYKTIEFEYCLDGSMNIIERDYKTASMNEKEVFRKKKTSFNNKGELLSIDTDNERIIYEYENNVLKKIIFSGGIIEIVRIGDEQLFFKQEVNRKEKILTEKRYYRDGSLVRIEHYKKDNEKITCFWNIEYYPKTDA